MNLVRLGGTLVGTASLLAAAGTTTRAQGVVAVRGATVHTAAGAPIAGATILVREGKIAAAGRDVAIPAGATIIDATGKVITPGMIDEHSHIGARPTDLNDRPMIIGPQHRILDALDLGDPDWKDAVGGGVTTVITGPGGGGNESRRGEPPCGPTRPWPQPPMTAPTPIGKSIDAPSR